MSKRATGLLAFEIQMASTAAMPRKLQEEIGRGLSECSRVRAVWLAAEDAGTKLERRHVQVALAADVNDGTDVELLLHLERKHRVKLAVLQCSSAGDLVPHEIVDELGLDQRRNNRWVSVMRTDWNRVEVNESS
ncbi:hypothetical protein WDU99_15770 [Microbacterium sp. Mu-80]|uniref:Uncharacterized protein n=1 Tax=Microbacterium bandirmense TaxID=3122050 RepID=A0ABU8LEM5_9MICO